MVGCAIPELICYPATRRLRILELLQNVLRLIVCLICSINVHLQVLNVGERIAGVRRIIWRRGICYTRIPCTTTTRNCVGVFVFESVVEDSVPADCMMVVGSTRNFPGHIGQDVIKGVSNRRIRFITSTSWSYNLLSHLD